jgi:hypothetical protein
MTGVNQAQLAILDGGIAGLMHWSWRVREGPIPLRRTFRQVLCLVTYFYVIEFAVDAVRLDRGLRS